MPSSPEIHALVVALTQARETLSPRLRVTSSRWDSYVTRLGKVETEAPEEVVDEEIWTWLLCCGYAAGGASGVASLAGALTGGEECGREEHALWLEYLPLPPRKREGNTHLDLALGDLQRREDTKGGLVPAPGAKWICFCEMKWYSDLSLDVANDAHRNQLARVVENALVCGQQTTQAERVHVTLVTPAAFQDRRSRLYAFKMREYQQQPELLLQELLECRLEPAYPLEDLAERMRALRLHWVAFDGLFEGLPATELGAAIRAFRDRFDGTRDL